MTIKHLVISGGGPSLIQSLSAIQHLTESQFMDINNIESIYGTSAGAIVAILLCLKYDWNTLNDYIIKRPWHDVFHVKIQNIFDAYYNKGLFDNNILDKCFQSLFDAKDISMKITLEEFFEYSKIEIHFFTFEFNEFVLEDISYITHPKLELMTAIKMTCALPIFVTPIFMDGKCYVDGGLACNYSLEKCIDSGKHTSEILGLKNHFNINNSINSNSTLMDYIMTFIHKLIKIIGKLNVKNTDIIIENEIIFEADIVSVNSLSGAFSDIEVRKNLFNRGKHSAIQFLASKQTNTTEKTEKTEKTDKTDKTNTINIDTSTST